MTETSWPFHSGGGGTPVYEDEWSIMARQWAHTGVVGYPADDDLQVYANSSGREVHVRAGRASVRGHWLDVDAQVTLPVAENVSGLSRDDLVVARLDPSDDSITLAVLEGTPSGILSGAPTPTQTDTGVYDLPLAMVTVPNGAAVIAGGNVYDRREFTDVPFTPALSSRLPVPPLGEQVGRMLIETDTGIVRWWNGTIWAKVVPDVRYAAVRRTNAPSGISGGSGWQTIQFATGSVFDESSDAALLPDSGGVITIPVAGIYTVSAQMQQDSAGWKIGLNTSLAVGRLTLDVANGGYAAMHDTRYYPAGATLALQVFRSGPVVNYAGLSIARLGPATVA